MGKDASQGSFEPLIFSIRGQRVMLDADLARLYGVTTRRFNEAFRRNRERFPDDFAFQLTISEYLTFRSQLAPKNKDSRMWSQFATTYGKRRPLGSRPWAFTEHGALMAANLLRSEQAIRMSLFVIRAFIRLRERAVSNVAILKRLAEIDSTLLRHDAALRDIYQKLLPLLRPEPQIPKRGIGFHVRE